MSPPKKGWFVRKLEGGETQLWHFRDHDATRVGVSAPERGPGTFFKANPGETIWDALRRDTDWLDGHSGTGPFVAVSNEAGHYHPRMARPVHGYGISCRFR